MKNVSITGAAGLYVTALFSGALALIGYFFFPHSVPVLAGSVVASIVALSVAVYSVRLVVKANRGASFRSPLSRRGAP